jgi:hypothetical protein
LQSLEQAQVLQEQGVILIELVVDEGLLEGRFELVLFSWYEAWYEMEKKKTDRKRETRAAFIARDGLSGGGGHLSVSMRV